jgi:predicted lipid-binding transport protein (Tim44 family)
MKQEVNKMDNTNKKNDRSTWAIGGGLLLGMGVGFFFLKESVLAFVGSMFIGLGLGLMITSIISRVKQK